MLLTAIDDPESRAEALRLGAAAVFAIDERFDVNDLCACVRGVVPPG
jgi:hypothetical protein